MVGILNELCATLEAMDTKQEGARTNRPSIVDPNVIAMKGRLATNTSSKVDMTSKQPGTKTVSDYQIAALGRERKPKTSRGTSVRYAAGKVTTRRRAGTSCWTNTRSGRTVSSSG